MDLLNTYTLVAAGLAALIVAIKVHSTIICSSKKPTEQMNGKTVIITGANSGIGKQTAIDLARRGARVILACRNLKKAEDVKDEIIDNTGNPEIVIKKLDLSSFKSVREFAAEINRTETKLDVLVHNAGIAEVYKKEVSEDGIELTMATNHYGPFLLTHLLIDLLKRSAPSRIVVVASAMHKTVDLELKDANPINWSPMTTYSMSKRANIFFTRELARRLAGTNVTANSQHPGVISTEIFRTHKSMFSFIYQFIAFVCFKTVEQGAQTSIYLSVSKEVEGVTGKYFKFSQEDTSLSRKMKDAGFAKLFWDKSVELVKLTPADPKI